MSVSPVVLPRRMCLVLGAGGHAASVHDVVTQAGWTVSFFVGQGDLAELPAPLMAREAEAISMASREGHLLVLGIGANEIRLTLWDTLPQELRAPAIAAPSATVAHTAVVEPGTVIHNHAHVGPRSRIGSAVIVNTSAIVEHDCDVAAGAHIAPGSRLLGACRVGRGALVGAGATVLPGVRIGDGAVVGAGAVVTTDVADGATVTGIPAREKPAA